MQGMNAETPIRFGSAMRGTKAAASNALTPSERQARLVTLQAKWTQFAGEYAEQQRQGDQEVLTNLRGLMLSIKREVARLGGKLPEFPVDGPNHLADL